MKIGIEIEAVYNRNVVGDIVKGGHGEGTPFSFRYAQPETFSGVRAFLSSESSREDPLLKNPRWRAESDGSLRNYIGGDLTNWSAHTIELVSKVANDKDDFINMLNELKGLMTLNCANVELKDVMNFNDSCGCHLHFSFPDFNINKICGYLPLTRVRKTFFDGLNTLDIDAKLKQSIRNQYFRRYARRLTKKGWKNNTHHKERNAEFNFYYFEYHKGYEWRSVN